MMPSWTSLKTVPYMAGDEILFVSRIGRRSLLLASAHTFTDIEKRIVKNTDYHSLVIDVSLIILLSPPSLSVDRGGVYLDLIRKLWSHSCPSVQSGRQANKCYLRELWLVADRDSVNTCLAYYLSSLSSLHSWHLNFPLVYHIQSPGLFIIFSRAPNIHPEFVVKFHDWSQLGCCNIAF